MIIKFPGYNLSRSGLYLRLFPKNSTTIEGRRHVTTVPVRLIRPENNERKNNPDGHFASATVKYVKDLASLFGSGCVFVCSQDDKARIPLGLPAANKQAPILMHLSYKVKLPDHDWVVASKHKLIPSVFAALSIDDKLKTITYSGPTYVAIRSGKHDKSTAESHGKDFRRLMELENYANFVKSPGANTMKPIVCILSDGGPDENPRYPKVLTQAAHNFKLFDLDCIIVATNAAGLSAFNPVERRMASLSRDLSGLILPHDHFGTHLDDQCRTNDINLEKKNFQKAGEILSEVWSENKIDGYDVFAEYISPADGTEEGSKVLPLSEEWKCIHVRQSHYFLQIVKCDNRNCCKDWRSNYPLIIKNRFLPPPLLFHKSENGIRLCEPTCTMDHAHSFQDLPTRLILTSLEPSCPKFRILPFDAYCPSQIPYLEERVCPTCNISLATKTAKAAHKKVHGRKK